MKYWKIHYLIGFAFFDIVEPRNLPEIFSTDLCKKTCWSLISEKKLIGSMYDTSSYQFQFLCSIVGWTWFFSTIGVSVELDDALLKFQLQGMPLKDTQTTVKGNEKSLKKHGFMESQVGSHPTSLDAQPKKTQWIHGNPSNWFIFILNSWFCYTKPTHICSLQYLIIIIIWLPVLCLPRLLLKILCGGVLIHLCIHPSILPNDFISL